jgi:Mg-chelatase subunit ChlD
VLKSTVYLAALILAIGPLFAAAANTNKEEKPPLDAVVIMDSSGSMKFNDPQQLRKPAAKLFITLLSSKDKLSILSFSSKAWPIPIGQSAQFLTQLSTAEIKHSAFKATDRISHKGMHTNIYAALSRAMELVKQSKQQNRQPIIILMSDGKMDVDDATRSQQLRKKIIDELIPQLKENGIKVYSIAFTQQSDQQLLQQIAQATNGRYALAESADVLHKVFAKIFEQSKQPNMLPLTENKFLVDTSIQEVTIIVNKKNDASKIFLQAPDSKRYNAQTHKKNMQWFVSSSFDMITISQPEDGEWSILFSDNDNKAYIITDLQLRSEFEYSTDNNSAELAIKAWLKKDDKILTNNELVNNLNINLEIEHPDKQLKKIDFSGSAINGVFRMSFTPSTDGIYSATVIATSKTFQRQQFFSFRVSTTKQETKETAIAKQIKTEANKPTSEQISTPEPESNIIQTLIIFVIGNLILVFVGFNIYFIYKYINDKKQRKQIS